MTDTLDENKTKDTTEESAKKENMHTEELSKKEEKRQESKELRTAGKSYTVEKPAPVAQGPQISLAAALLLMVVTFGVGLVLGGFFLRLGGSSGQEARRGGAQNTPQATSVRLKMEIPADAPSMGPADAPVTIAVFDDFQCPWCEKASHVIKRVLSAFPNDVRFVMIHFPLEQLHPQAHLAAQAATEAAAQGKFKQMHDLIFANQRSVNRENLDKWAAQIGLDMTRFKNAMDQGTHRELVQRHMTMGRNLGVRGTPTILINGRRFNITRDVDQNLEVMKSIVKEELETIRQKNIPRAQAWKMLTADGVATLDQMISGPQARPENAPQNAPMRAARREVDPNVVYKVEVDPSDPWKGDPKALVTIVEFSDYQCPHCKNAESIIEQVLQAYPTGVRVVFMNNPLRFHPQAMPAAIAALEVKEQKGLDAYWAFHKKIFENQQQISPENLEKWLTEAGIDMAKYKVAVEKKTHEATIQRHQGLALKFGARGTPAFFINGYFLSGARSLEHFKTMIDREMQKANQAIADGKTTPENYYAFLMSSAEPQVKWIGGEDNGQSARPRRPARPRLDATKVYRVWPEGGVAEFEKMPYFGDSKAPVTVVMALDIECPWCEKLMPTIDELLDGTPVPQGTQPGPDHFAGYKTGVRFVLLHFPLPFHKNAMLAHQAAQEVFEQKGPEGFRQFLKKCFQNQKALSRDNLETWAQEVGVKMPRFKEALDKELHKPFIEKLQQMGRAVGVQGTPTIYINGKLMLGRGLPIFRKAIEEAQAQADALIKNGIAPGKVYEEIMKTAEPKAIWIQPEENVKNTQPTVQIQKVDGPLAPATNNNVPKDGFKPLVPSRVVPLQPKSLTGPVPKTPPAMNP